MRGLSYHIPALRDKTIEGLITDPSGVYVDCTFGGGGHSKAILEKLSDKGRLYSFDRDSDTFENVPKDARLKFVHSNFRYVKNFMRYYGIESVDGILADLGVSFHHFDDPTRGFSFRFDSSLDMRMNKNAITTATDVVNNFDVDELTIMFRIYGEMKNARKIAEAIASKRTQTKIETTFQLLEIVKPYINPRQEKKELAQLFQALRIKVNNEMDALQMLLESSASLLKQGGRLAIITYHSLEDRMVKNFMKSGNVEGRIDKDFFGNVISPLKPVMGKPIVPDESEINANPRSRSAKLRIAEKRNLQNDNL